MGKSYYVSDVTGNRYDKEEYANHGYGGRRYCMNLGWREDLPHDEYPYSEIEEKTEDELLGEFMEAVFCELRKRSEANRVVDEDFDKRLAKASANWMKDVVFDHLKKRGLKKYELPLLIEPERLRELIVYVEFTDLIDFSKGKKVLEEMLETGEDAWPVMERLGMLIEVDGNELETAINEVLAAFPDKVEAFKSGKKGLLGMFVGQVMRKVDNADGKEVNRLLTEKLS